MVKFDSFGKSMGQTLLQMPIPVPRALANSGTVINYRHNSPSAVLRRRRRGAAFSARGTSG